MTPLIIPIPVRIQSEANLREHWAVKAKRAKRQRQIVALTLTGYRKPPPPVTVLLTRIAPRALDDDNNAGGFKHVRDEIAKWLGVDDADPRVTWRYSQRKGAPRYYAAEAWIEERES